MMINSKPDFQKAYIKANEILVSSKIINSFPYSAIKLIKEQSNIVCRSFEKAHKYNVDIEAFGSDSAVIMNFGDKYIISTSFFDLLFNFSIEKSIAAANG